MTASMHKLVWHKLTAKNKEVLKRIANVTLVMGSAFVESARLKQVAQEYGKAGTVIFGSLLEEQIPELVGTQFASLPLAKLETALDGSKNTAILSYLSVHSKYIIEELRPKRVLWFNGSWSRVLHYREEFWSAFNSNAKVEMLSPFMSEANARKYSAKIQKRNEAEFDRWLQGKTTRLQAKQLLDIAEAAKALSWDWDGQTGAVIARKGELLSYGYNIVLPYPAAEMHEGSLRDHAHAPLGERLEFYQTNHAELSAILRAQEAGHNLTGTTLYTTKFPCPFCARVIADSDIERIVYTGEYTNNMGYEMLERAGKKLVKASTNL